MTKKTKQKSLPVKTQNEWGGSIGEKIWEEAELRGVEPGFVVREIVYQHYNRKAA